MIEQLLWRFLEYRKRKQAVIIVTILTGLVAVWPAADEYIAARSRYSDARSDLEETERQLNNLPKFTQLFEKRRSELEKLEKQSLDPDAAQALRGTLLQLIRETGCTMRYVRLSDPVRRDWLENDDPLGIKSLTERGGETPFQLVTRQMSVSISGPMANLNKFLERLNGIERLIHTNSISLQRSGQRTTTTALDMEILLFELARKSA
jgi:hypothetical protein